MLDLRDPPRLDPGLWILLRAARVRASSDGGWVSGVDQAGMDDGLGVSERMRDGLACQGSWSVPGDSSTEHFCD